MLASAAPAAAPTTRPGPSTAPAAPARPRNEVASPRAGVPVRQPAEAPWRNPRALFEALRLQGTSFAPVTMAWICAVVLMVLLIQSRPWLSAANADACMLALTGLLLSARSAAGLAGDEATVRAARWWATVLLAATAAYWSARGVHLTLSQSHRTREPNLATRALGVLVVVIILVLGRHLTLSALDPSSIDGIFGGRVVLQTAHLPYGDIPGHDTRGPWLYALHAAALKVTSLLGGHVGRDLDPLTDDELIAARLVHALLVALLLWGSYRIGRKLHAPAIGLTLVVALTVFGGVLACLTRVDLLLVAVLLVWAAGLALNPGLGSILSSLLIVVAAFEWLWAWLLVPVIWAYWLRQRWHAVGATLGWIVAAAGCGLVLTLATAPALPRIHGALAAAGRVPQFVARQVQQQTAIIERAEPAEPPATGPAALIWRWLLERDRLHLATSSTRPALPSGVDRSRVLYRDIAATGPARALLQQDYRRAAVALPLRQRLVLAARTWLEAVLLAPQPRHDAGWQTLAGGAADRGAWRVARGAVLGLVLLLVVLISLALLGRARPGCTQLFGALLAVVAAVMLVSNGGVADQVLWAPLALAATVATSGPARTQAAIAPDSAVQAALRPVPPGPAPRITVER